MVDPTKDIIDRFEFSCEKQREAFFQLKKLNQSLYTFNQKYKIKVNALEFEVDSLKN